MTLDLSPQNIGFASFIFALRILNTAIGTVRLVALTRQQKVLASVLAFFESLLFALSIGSVANDLNNILNLTAYCGGFAAGNYIGILLERRLITSYMTVNVIASEHGQKLAGAMRTAGFGVTVTSGEGKDGMVMILRSVVSNRDVSKLLTVVRDTHENAFIAVEEARVVHRGWVRMGRDQEE